MSISTFSRICALSTTKYTCAAYTWFLQSFRAPAGMHTVVILSLQHHSDDWEKLGKSKSFIPEVQQHAVQQVLSQTTQR